MTDVELLVLHSNTWNHLTICRQMSSGSFKNVNYKLCIYKLYVCMYVYIYVYIDFSFLVGPKEKSEYFKMNRSTERFIYISF